MESNNLFKPRDFIYINEDKLNSYFSQLYGGLIINQSNSNIKEKSKKSNKNLSGGLDAKLSTDTGSLSILNAINNLIGTEIQFGGEVNFDYNSENKKEFKNNKTYNQVLSHFKYAMFEKSISDLNYLIDLDDYISKNKVKDSGRICNNLLSTDFIKFRATTTEIRDYRNAREFISLLKKIFDIAVSIKSGEVYDDSKNDDEKRIHKISQMEVIKDLLGESEISNKTLKTFEALVNIIDEIFNGDIIPLDLMMISEKNITGNSGKIKFESLLKEKYFLEDRVDLSFKYGTFEDANWTIVGQLTTTKVPSKSNIMDVLERYTNKINNLQNKYNNKKEFLEGDINEFIKIVIKEIDIFSKKIGLVPQLSSKHRAITPIAIFREPKINQHFNNDKK